MKRIAELLGVDEWAASEYGVDEKNRLSHICSIMQGEEKAAYVEALSRELRIAKDHTTAYTDSFLDLKLLASVGTPVAVNPDRSLKKIANQNQWEIL